MEIDKIHTTQTNTTFLGKLHIPEKVSDVNAELVKKSVEKLSKTIEELPCDVYIKEAETKENNACSAITITVKETPKKPARKIPIIYIIAGILTGKSETILEADSTLRQLEEQLKKADSGKITDVLVFSEEKINTKPFAPRKIGKPVKPYIHKKKRRY